MLVALLKVLYPVIRLEKPRKNTATSVRIRGNPANVRTGYLPNASQEFYRHTNLLGECN